MAIFLNGKYGHLNTSVARGGGGGGGGGAGGQSPQ